MPSVAERAPGGEIDDLLADLSRWTSDRRADDAARSRIKERWLRQQSQEAATFLGLVTDLVEREATVTVRTVNGRSHAGRLSTAGRDFVVVRTGAGAAVLVAVSAIAALRPPPGFRAGEAEADREPPVPARLRDVIIGVAADRPRVQLVCRGGEVLAGDLRSVGTDVATIRLDGDHATTAYVPLDTIDELTILG